MYVRAIHPLFGKVQSLFLDNPESGYFGSLKTTELLSRDFKWPVIYSPVHKDVSGC